MATHNHQTCMFPSSSNCDETLQTQNIVCCTPPPPFLVPPPFATPPKLLPIEHVLKDNPGNSFAALRILSTALARDAIFGRDEMVRCSLSGRKGIVSLDTQKLDYIKSVVKSRVPRMPPVEFEYIWSLC